ncbi:MarR family transcriptional regulator [Omnitrophica bacterium]|nr:MarR family transcriptional regulator [Candidatus Omnitrophota bacterium]
MPAAKKSEGPDSTWSLQKQKDSDLKVHYYWGRVRRYGESYKDFHWPSSEVILSLAYAYDTLRVHFARFLNPFGLSLAAFNTLMILESSERHGCKQRDLSKLLLVSRANITGLVDSLKRRGLVSRKVDKNDRRVFIVKITAKGERLLKALLPEHYRRINDVTSVLESTEKTELSSLLGKIRKRIILEKE